MTKNERALLLEVGRHAQAFYAWNSDTNKRIGGLIGDVERGMLADPWDPQGWSLFSITLRRRANGTRIVLNNSEISEVMSHWRLERGRDQQVVTVKTFAGEVFEVSDSIDDVMKQWRTT